MLIDKKIAVLMGGSSAEREVSLKSGMAVSSALSRLGYRSADIDAGADLCKRLADEDIGVAFIALHGGWGEDGSIQGLLEVMGIPYTGSGVLASAMAMDKIISKKVFTASGISVPQYDVISADEIKNAAQWLHARLESGVFSLPVVVKPSREGSSIGVSIVRSVDEFAFAAGAALAYGSAALVERYILGREIQIGILSGMALGGVEVRPKKEFYDYEAKYTAGMTEYILPPEIDGRMYENAKAAALSAHSALGCSGATRVDLLIDGDGLIYTLEVNTIPGLTETSLLPKIANMAGVGFESLIERMIADALDREIR